MKRIVNFFVMICFCAWLVPLGAFVKPSQQKKVCDGQRAICLCSHRVKPGVKTTTPVYQGNATKEKESNGPTNNHFFVLKQVDRSAPKASRFSSKTFPPHTSLVLRPIEHIPKV